MKKSVLVMILAGLVLLMMTAAGTAESGKWGDGVFWTLDAQGVLTFTGSGEMYNAYPDSPWKGKDIRKVVIGEGITTIGQCAFSECRNLTEAEIASTVTEIGESAFGSCTGLKSFAIPGTVETIGDSAFCMCTGLTSVTIGEGVLSLENGAFDGCSGLKTVTIPKSVVNIGFEAFAYCTSLTEINIRSLRTYTGLECTFTGCTSLQRINFSADNEDYSSRDGIMYSKDGKTAVLCPPGRSGACTVPGGTTAIGEGAFADCGKLTGVTVPEGVKEIGGSAFSDCVRLAYIKLPASLDFVEGCAFANCNVLRTVYYGGTQKDQDRITIIEAENNALLEARWHLSPGGIVTGGVKLKLDSRTKTAKVTGPKNKNVKTIMIPATLKYDGLTYKVTEISAGAFKGCGKLTKATIGKNVAKIGGKAFYGCGKLKTIILKTEKLKEDTVGANAFGKTYAKAVFECPPKKLKAYRKWLPKRGAGKKAVIR